MGQIYRHSISSSYIWCSSTKALLHVLEHLLLYKKETKPNVGKEIMSNSIKNIANYKHDLLMKVFLFPVQASWFEGVVKCLESDSLKCVIDKIVKAEVHRLVIVDEEDHVCGIISLSDLLNYLILKPMDCGKSGGIF